MIKQNINVSKYKPLSGSSYIKLPKELNHSRKDLLNIQYKDDSKCLRWCLVKYSNPLDHHPARIRKLDKAFPRKLDWLLK